MSPENPIMNGLGNRLTALVFVTVIVTLALVGSIFWWVTGTFHESQARAKVAASVRAVQFDLRLIQSSLEETSRRLANQASVMASAKRIYASGPLEKNRYQNIDLEKKKLALNLYRMTTGNNLALVAFYTPDDRVMAFSLKQGGFVSPGFQTYDKNGTSRYKLIDPEQPQGRTVSFTPSSLLFLSDLEPGIRAGRIFTRVQDDGLVIDFTIPIVRKGLDGKPQNLGWLRTVRFIGNTYFSNIGSQIGVRAVFVKPAKSKKAAGQFDGDVPVLVLSANAKTAFAWSANKHEFSGAVRLQGVHGKSGLVVFSLVNVDLMAGFSAFRDAALIVLILTALIFVPAMLYFVHKNITDPLNALVERVRRIRNNEHVTPVGKQRSDEIGTLAKAFDEMAITVQTRERELRKKQALLDGMVNNAPSLIQMKDIEGRYVLVNNRWQQFFGKTQDEVQGLMPYDFLPREMADLIQEHDAEVVRSRMPHQFEEILVGDQSTRLFVSTKFPLINDKDEVYAICGISQDITERKKTEDRLRLTQRVVDETVEGIMITDTRSVIVDVNPAFTTITGYSRDEIIGQTPKIMSSGRHDNKFYMAMWSKLKKRGQWKGEIWDRRKNGEAYPKWLSITAVYNDERQVTHYVGVFSDISKAKETERQLEQLAHYDALTGLPNRTLFQDHLRRALARHRRHDHKGALLFIDLDRFKQVNDSLGHEQGDDLLIEATSRLIDCVREDDTVARLGGDEFAVVLNDLQNENRAHDVAQRIIHLLEEPFALTDNEVFISASIGIAFFPEDGDSIEELSRNADMAMYEAKGKGRATFRFFNKSMDACIRENMELETGLRGASLNDELRLFFQPKYDIEKGRITSTEALVRWMHPERGLLQPDTFIPLAEETGLILEIGRWVLFEACRQVRVWRDELGYNLPVAVNLSARQFSDPALSDYIALALRENDLSANMLSVEVTESMVMEDVNKTIGILHRLKRLGVSISIDDFGTGYSSLSQLRKLPVDELKIDRTFVCDIPGSSEDMEIVTAIISMAKSLNLSVVAEGVETLEQLEFLRKQHCQEVQGYLIGKPVEGRVLPVYLSDEAPNANLLARPGSKPKGPKRTLQ